VKRSKPAAVPPTPGPETTVIDGPLDASGLIDYETALNERLRGTSTPDTNALVLLLRVFGPKPEGNDLHPDVYKWLGTAAPPDEGPYFVRSATYFGNQLEADNPQAIQDRESALRDGPWTANEESKFADWIVTNEKPLAVATEAVKRPDYFHPLVSRAPDGTRGNLIGALLPLVQKCREIASILSLRVTLRCGEKKYDAAWQDVMTMHRLGRLMGQGGTLIELLVAYAIDSIARNSALRLLEAVRPTAQQALAWGCKTRFVNFFGVGYPAAGIFIFAG